MAVKPTNENLLQRLTRENQERRAERYRGQRRHWQMFNASARIVGCSFIFVGVIFSFSGILLLLDSKASIGVNGTPTTDPWTKAIELIAGLVFFALGLLLVLARRYRPDLDDSALTNSKKVSADEIESHDKAT
jgi:hypothetical protein